MDLDWLDPHQLDTSVAGAEEPQLRMVDTFNAASNLHMIGIDDAIGYRVIGSQLEYQITLS